MGGEVIKWRPRWTDRAEDGLAGVFVLLATFIGLGVIIISATANLALSNKLSNTGGWEFTTGYQIIGEVTFTVLDPQAGYNVSSANTTDLWYHEADTNLEFSGEGYDDLTVGIIRDNLNYGITYHGTTIEEDTRFEDFVIVYTEYGWWSNDDVAISYLSIIENRMEASNISVIPFTIHDTSYSLIITGNGTAGEFDADLWQDDYNMKIGIPAWGEDDIDSIKSSSMWTILRQLMTASLPDVHPVINIMISIPFWSCLAVMSYLFVRSLLPF